MNKFVHELVPSLVRLFLLFPREEGIRKVEKISPDMVVVFHDHCWGTFGLLGNIFTLKVGSINQRRRTVLRKK